MAPQESEALPQKTQPFPQAWSHKPFECGVDPMVPAGTGQVVGDCYRCDVFEVYLKEVVGVVVPLSGLGCIEVTPVCPGDGKWKHVQDSAIIYGYPLGSARYAISMAYIVFLRELESKRWTRR